MANNELKDAVTQAAESWANAEFAHAKSLGAGGPGKLDACHKSENAFRAALDALLAAPAQGGLSDALPESVIAALWDAQRKYHGGEPCKFGHMEFARAIESRILGQQGVSES